MVNPPPWVVSRSTRGVVLAKRGVSLTRLPKVFPKGRGREGDKGTRGRINYFKFLTPHSSLLTISPNAQCPIPIAQFSIQATILNKINRI